MHQHAGVAFHREPGELGSRAKGPECLGRLVSVALSGQDGCRAEAVEDAHHRLRISIRLVHAFGSQRGGVEKGVSGNHEQEGNIALAKRPDLGGQSVKSAKRVTRAAARLEVALEVGHDGKAQGGLRLGGGFAAQAAPEA
jgi:hypothetical protein